MSTTLLAQALAMAANPRSGRRELESAVGDLIAFGALGAAAETVGRLRTMGLPRVAADRLDWIVHWMGNLGPQFDDRLLSRAIGTAGDPDASIEQLSAAAESLVVWGSLDEADRAIERLRKHDPASTRIAQLAAASRQLRRSGILEELEAITPHTSLNKPYEVLVRRRPGAERIIVVFTGFARRFWLSLNTTHLFLRKLNAHVIYLADHQGVMFLNGIASVGQGFAALVAMLRGELAKLGELPVHILASSAGGYIGLLTAMEIEAETFAGASIRTSLVETERRLLTPFERYGIARCREAGIVRDLRPLLSGSRYPRSVQLYCGDGNTIDLAHAVHVANLPQVDVSVLTNYRAHDAISGLIARGGFQSMLRRFVDPAAARIDRRLGIVPLAELTAEAVA